MRASGRRPPEEYLQPSGRSWWSVSVAVLGALAVSLLGTAPALAHSGHGHAGGAGLGAAVGPALLGGSVLVLGATVYLDRAGGIDGRYARAGILLGLTGALLGALFTLA